jgi:hypothetical protein
VQFIDAAIKRRVARKEIAGDNRRVGFYSAIGCKGRQRSIQVTFISESGQRTPKTRNKPC